MPRSRKLLAFLLLVNWLSATAYADVLGAADAAEIAKLTEIITQMTELLDKTQEYLDVQRRMTEMQERTFFRKARAYGKEIRQLVHKQQIFEEKTRDFKKDPLHIDAMRNDVQRIRQQAAQINHDDTKQNLLDLANTLELMGNTRWLAGTARAALEETASSADSNTQDQLLAGIFYTLVELRETIGIGEVNEDMREMDARWKMQGAYSIFTNDYEN